MEPQETADLIDFEQNLVRADTGKRFANYLIDVVVFYVLIFGITMGLALVIPSAFENMDDSPGFDFFDRILSLVFYGLYMSIVEGMFKGKSLGKLITKTRAVNLDGSQISWGTAFSRGFAKAVPFCAFSALSTPCNPWQDRWTDTMVVDERASF